MAKRPHQRQMLNHRRRSRCREARFSPDALLDGSKWIRRPPSAPNRYSPRSKTIRSPDFRRSVAATRRAVKSTPASGMNRTSATSDPMPSPTTTASAAITLIRIIDIPASPINEWSSRIPEAACRPCRDAHPRLACSQHQVPQFATSIRPSHQVPRCEAD